MFPQALLSIVLSRSVIVLCATGFVADIYNSSVAQGPSLPDANRSATMAIYNSNLTLLHSRLLGALAAVRQLCNVLYTLFACSIIQACMLQSERRSCC